VRRQVGDDRSGVSAGPVDLRTSWQIHDRRTAQISLPEPTPREVTTHRLLILYTRRPLLLEEAAAWRMALVFVVSQHLRTANQPRSRCASASRGQAHWSMTGSRIRNRSRSPQRDSHFVEDIVDILYLNTPIPQPA
jgi:hypothetical protein